jgi:hypothetical protein
MFRNDLIEGTLDGFSFGIAMQHFLARLILIESNWKCLCDRFLVLAIK